MKKIVTILFSVGLTALLLGACGQNNTDNNQPANNEQAQSEQNNQVNENGQDNQNQNDEPTAGENDSNTTDQANNDADMKNMMEKLNFKEFELEVSYPGENGHEKEYEVEIERHHDGRIEAEIEDELNGLDIDNDLKAFNKLYPMVKKLNITQKTKKQDVIDQVLEAFDLEKDYTEFEVEFKFNDGTKLEFEDKK